MPIKLLLADVDGTLVTHEKVLTEQAKAAVSELREAGIAFAITSGRPPRGMQMLIEPLSLITPIAAFNGGLFVRPNLSTIEQRVLQHDVVEPVTQLLKRTASMFGSIAGSIGSCGSVTGHMSIARNGR